MKSLILLGVLLLPAIASAQDKKTKPAAETLAPLSVPSFELFKLVPGQTEAFIRSVATWDQVNVAGGQPKTQLYLHEGGEDWDVMLYKPPRPTPTAVQSAAMAAKIKELGLSSGALFFVELREKVAAHSHLDMKGPMSADTWVAELDDQRAEKKARQ